MICKSFGYTPTAWTWYMTNGSEQVRFSSVGQAKQCGKNQVQTLCKV